MEAGRDFSWLHAARDAAAELGARALGAGGVALDVVLPPRCLGCGDGVDAQGSLCASCWPKLNFITAPHCAVCGFPFETESGPAALCGPCSRDRPLFDRARAVLRYDDGSRDLVIAFKHRDRTDSARSFARWMAGAGGDLVRDAGVIVPVPLHRWRLLKRRFNQSALLAQALSRGSGVPCAVDALVRTRRTPPQGRLSATQRRDNVRGAFALRRGREDTIKGRRVLLVDDVLTTGATVTACVRPLLRAGATAVDVLTLARVVRPSV